MAWIANSGLLARHARTWLAAGLLSLSGTAQAEWLKADSAHFTVYSEGDEASIRDAAVRLEKLDSLQRLVAGGAPKPSPLKVAVYLLPNNEAVQAVLPWGGGGGPNFAIAGFYDASDRGPFAVNTRTDARKEGFPAQLVLFHELTHHFMLQYFPAAYPLWYREGFADFVGSATFKDDGTAEIGDPVGNRYYALQTLRNQSWISMWRLLAAKGFDDVQYRTDLLYAEGWLLTHYLTIQGNRRGQLTRYLAAINAGTPLAKAATDAFGDLAKLDRELKAYAKLKVLNAKVVPVPPPASTAITVSHLGPAQAALMTYDIRLRAGVPQLVVRQFTSSLRKAAQKYADDPYALQLRCEADRLTGDLDDRRVAVATWEKVAPRDPMLMLHRALLEQDGLAAAKSTDVAAWDAVRKGIASAMRADRSNPEIFKAYFQSYIDQGVMPAEAGHNALFMALQLVPQNDEIRYALARDFEQRGMIQDAIATIAPIAYVDDDIATGKYQRQRAAKDRIKFRIAGTSVHESPREMLVRLEAATNGPAPPKG